MVCNVATNGHKLQITLITIFVMNYFTKRFLLHVTQQPVENCILRGFINVYMGHQMIKEDKMGRHVALMGTEGKCIHD